MSACEFGAGAYKFVAKKKRNESLPLAVQCWCNKLMEHCKVLDCRIVGSHGK